MQGNRVDRLNSLLKDELGQVITTRLSDTRLGFVTVTSVDIAPDMKDCRVSVSVLGDEKQIAASLAALKHAEGFLKREIARHLKLRFTPDLHFRLDKSIDSSLRLAKIFEKIHSEEPVKETDQASSSEDNSTTK